MHERRKAQRFTVNWRGRALLQDRSMYQISIKDVSKGGVLILFDHVLAKETPVNIEITIPSKVNPARIRAKTVVAHHTLLSNGMAQLGLLFVEISSEDFHTLNNALQELGDRSN